MAKLPDYNSCARCPKCGSLSISTLYKPMTLGCRGRFDDSPAGRDSIKRTCPRCLYHWYELPLDAQEPSE